MNRQMTIKGDFSGGKALVMVHGRGSDANDILSLAAHLPVTDFTLIAPQAPGNTWYPYSFMAPQQQNQPYLDASLNLLQQCVDTAKQAGVEEHRIFFLGFSQGACLTLEFAARHARPWGGVIAFTGGLIGETLNTAHYKGDFGDCPIYIGASDPDPHVPAERVKETEQVLRGMNARVEAEIFKNMGHTISPAEIKKAAIILGGKN